MSSCCYSWTTIHDGTQIYNFQKLLYFTHPNPFILLSHLKKHYRSYNEFLMWILFRILTIDLINIQYLLSFMMAPAFLYNYFFIAAQKFINWNYFLYFHYTNNKFHTQIFDNVIKFCFIIYNINLHSLKQILDWNCIVLYFYIYSFIVYNALKSKIYSLLSLFFCIVHIIEAQWTASRDINVF